MVRNTPLGQEIIVWTQEADLHRITADVLAGWGNNVAAVYTIAPFDQNPQGLVCHSMLSQLRIDYAHCWMC